MSSEHEFDPDADVTGKTTGRTTETHATGVRLFRRRVLGLAASAGTVGVAGCVGGDDSAGDRDGDQTDDVEAVDDDAEADEDADDGDEDDEDQASVEIPDNAYDGPSGDEPAPVQVVAHYYAAVNANDPDETARYEHSAYPWGGATQEDFEEVVWFDDLELALIDEDLDEEEIEDISMFSFASSRSRDAILEAAEGEDTALVSVEGTGKEEGEEVLRQAEHLLVTEDGEWKIAL